MSDYKRLKHLALAQPVKEWRSEEGEPSMMTGERMYYIVGPGGVSCWEHGAYNRVSASYIAAANPAVVLGLIADLDGYKQGAKVEADAADEARAEVRRLKAECEGLPKHAPSSEIIWCECGDGYPANSYGAGFMAANGGACENCDAAEPELVKITCSLEFFENLRDSAAAEAEEHRQCMGSYRPHRQELLDAVVRQCDELIAGVSKGEQA